MEWMVTDEITRQPRRKYSNETVRKLKQYIDLKGLKPTDKAYNQILDQYDILLSDKRLRTEEELQEDRAQWQHPVK